jgi:hypothetical protein
MTLCDQIIPRHLCTVIKVLLQYVAHNRTLTQLMCNIHYKQRIALIYRYGLETKYINTCVSTFHIYCTQDICGLGFKRKIVEIDCMMRCMMMMLHYFELVSEGYCTD